MRSMRWSRILLLVFVLVHVGVRLSLMRGRHSAIHEQIADLKSLVEQLRVNEDLIRSGEICVTYGVGIEIVEHHKARRWTYGNETGFFCPPEDFRRAGHHGMLFSPPVELVSNH